ncbi:FHA domain-containing protein [Bifidobacterium sp. ESL0682]|uniref:FHA domain-containing protein n=1 Tax=Bifidobacterium sp. ESL0682 TaxID=2983212 RepID=UPI0023F98C26|nr:FHA domain-containing protein [Bifidobacterium sp. ESL0682]WEV42294.1 FHA domain-containing protein [Bifidobacterium sp. ESL0682]
MSDPRTTKHWVIKVNGSTKVDVGPGENVEIGRRPLRPLANDGRHRLEIDDKTRSMSKRHAVFTVADNGGASVTDLNSTNGSYVVDDKGLRRLKANQDFILPDSPVRLQFGDVPVDFVRIDVEEKAEDNHLVTDLFDYALSGAQNPDIEPDMADMSVDDILNLRAGEPTTAFSAADVANRLQSASAVGTGHGDGQLSQSAQPEQGNANNADNKDVKDSEVSDEKEPGEGAVEGAVANPAEATVNDEINHAVDRISLNVMAASDAQSGDGKARDLFKDAMESELENHSAPAGNGGEAQAMQRSQAPSSAVSQSQDSADSSADSPVQAAQSESGVQRVSLPSRRGDGQNSQTSSQLVQQENAVRPAGVQQSSIQSVGLPQDSVQSAGSQQGPVQSADVQQKIRNGGSIAVTGQASASGRISGLNGNVERASERNTDNVTANANQPMNMSGSVSGNEQSAEKFSRSGSDSAVFVPMDKDPRPNGSRPVSTQNMTPAGNIPTNESSKASDEERNKFMRPVVRDMGSSPVSGTSGLDETQAFKPTFEPGSVFEKVSNGEFDQKAPEVEIEGMSSDDAKRTTDFSQQFEMAKHPELLPFLAMNPSLYDDLYEWLSAVGNNDIDTALAANSGYVEYRKQVAEGREQ